MGLDFGSKTIGVAISDEGGRLAFGIETLRREREENLKANVHKIGDIIKEYGVKTVVLGYPLNMDGSLSERCEKTLLFMDRLRRTFKKVKFELQDERLTSVIAERAMKGIGIKKRGTGTDIDTRAAILILQTYLDRINLNVEGD